MGFAGNRLAEWFPSATGTTQVFGWGFGATGTVTLESVTDASFRAQLPRTRLTAPSSLDPDSLAALISAAPFGSQGEADGHGGFQLVVAFGLAENLDDTAMFVGIADGAGSILDQPSLGECIGVGFASTSITTDELRLFLPGDVSFALDGVTRNTTSVYQLTITCPPYAAANQSFVVQLVDLAEGTLLYEAVLDDETYTLPPRDTLFRVHAEVLASVASLEPAIELASMRLSMPDGAKRYAQRLGEAGIFNVLHYGAVGDFDGTTGTDNGPAFARALRAMQGKGGTLIVPPGAYFLADGWRADLGISGPVVLRGAAPGSRTSASRLHFAPFTGIQAVRRVLQGVAELVLEDLALIGGNDGGEGRERAVEWPVWTASTHYTPFAGTLSASNAIVPPGPRLAVNVIAPLTTPNPDASFEYVYVCILEGDSGGTAPDFSQAFRPDVSVPHAEDAFFEQYALVRAPDIYDRYFVALFSGTTDATAPTEWPEIGSTTTDGGVDWLGVDASPYLIADGGSLSEPTGCIWSCRTLAGLYSEERVSLRRVWVESFFNAGVHLQPNQATDWRFNPPPSQPSASAGYDVTIVRCGAGLVTRDDANGCTFFSLRVVMPRPPEEATPEEIALYDRHLAVAERSTRGNTYLGARLSCTGPMMLITGADNTSGVGGTFARAGDGPFDVRSPKSSFWGGNIGANFLEASVYQGSTSRDHWEDVVSTMAGTVDVTVKLKPDAASVYGFGSSDDASGFRMVYGLPGEGWWGVTHGTSTVAMAYSNANASINRAGVTWFPGGVHFGTYAAGRQHFSVGPEPAPTSGNQGDVVWNEAATTTGDPLYWQRTSVGWSEGPLLP